MSYKVLVTCPPMLLQIDRFSKKFSDLNIEVTTPEIKQTLSVDELIQIVPEHDGWIIGDDPATKEVFSAGKKGSLRAAVKWGIGTDNVDFKACDSLSIPIKNTPGMFGGEVADVAIAYIIGLARNLFEIDRNIRRGGWPKPAGISINNKTLGIIGLGDIGSNVASRANALGMKIVGWDPYSKETPDYIRVERNWPDGIEDCDFIVFTCALTNETKHMLNKKVLEKIENGVRIINVSRGPLIETSALMEGLKNKIIISAALDVFENEPIPGDHPILKYSNCILGSHNASNTIEAVDRATNKAIELLYEMLEGK